MAVLDEDLEPILRARGRRPDDVDVVADAHGDRIDDRGTAAPCPWHTEHVEQLAVLLVADLQNDVVDLEAFSAGQHDMLAGDLHDLTWQVTDDGPFVQQRLHLRPQPELDAFMNGRTSMTQVDLRTPAVAAQRRLHRGVASPHDQDPAAGIPVRVAEMASHMRQVLPRHPEPAGSIRAPRGQDQRAGLVGAVKTRSSEPHEPHRTDGARHHFGEGVDFQLVRGHVLPQVRQVLLARQFLLRQRGDRQAEQREAFRGGEEAGVRREGPRDGRAQRTGVDHLDIMAFCAEHRGRLESDRPGPDD